jgi:endonuclease I
LQRQKLNTKTAKPYFLREGKSGSAIRAALHHLDSSDLNLNSNENNFNTQTIASHEIPNGGKMRFRAAFLNRTVFKSQRIL